MHKNNLEKRKKIIIAAGGSGGHLYPAQGIAEELRGVGHEVLFVGGGLGVSPYFQRERYAHVALPTEKMSGKNPLAYLKGLNALLQGYIKAKNIIKTFSPDLVVGFGASQSLPVILAAKMAGKPLILHEANCQPGKVNRWLSPYADITGTHFKETMGLLKGKSCHVGMPLRTGYSKTNLQKEASYAYFGLQDGFWTLLVFGGSQGAHVINHLAPAAIAEVAKATPNLQVIHITGSASEVEEVQKIYRRACIGSYVRPFEERMDLAWGAADLCISRAGGSSLAEELEYEVPGILIPYPYAENHQEKNADAFIAECGGAIKLLQRSASSSSLAQEIKNFLANKGQLLSMMKQKMHSCKISGRNETFVQLINDYLNRTA